MTPAAAVTDAAAWERMLASMRAFFPTGLSTTSDFHVVGLDGVIACVAPSIPDRSLPNSVLYESEDALAAALPELARAYDEAGVCAWTVWTPEHDEREAPRPDDPVPDPEPSNADLGRVNDRAFGLTGAFTAILGDGPADPAHAYVARVGGEAAACVGTFDHDGDCSVYWVAVVPVARCRGLAAGLMRRAPADGRERGCEVSTLQATKLGQPVYKRLGYRAFGTFEMWERRAPAD